MQNEELLYLTASEPLTLSEEYDMQRSWFEDEDKCTFIILDRAQFEKGNDEIGKKNDKFIWSYINVLANVDNTCANWISLYSNTHFAFMYEESMIGDANLYFNNSDSAEIEVMIAESMHRSKGKGKEALLFMLRYGVETLKVEMFIAKIKMNNSVSIKLFESIGFVQTSSNDIFNEVTMTCSVTEEWKNLLLSRTSSYDIETTSYL